jgi:hypothetical protein
MTTAHEKLIAAHDAYKGVARREKKELRFEIEKAKLQIKKGEQENRTLINIELASSRKKLEELTVKFDILNKLVVISADQLDDRKLIIELLLEKVNA